MLLLNVNSARREAHLWFEIGSWFALNIFISMLEMSEEKIKDVNKKPGLDSDIGNGLNETT